MTARRGSRRSPFLPALFLALSSVLVSAPTALAVTPDEDPEAAAVAFLLDGYADHPDSFGFGTSSEPDLLFALAGAGVGATAAAEVLADLEAGAEGYLTNSGALAKVLLAVDIAGGDAADFAGRDLEQELRAAMHEDGAFDPYAVNQTYAILALARTVDGVPDAALAWLDGQQCEDGSVGNDFEETGEAQCPGDADTTALAVQAFLAAGRDVDAEQAVAWLLAEQAEDGSFSNFGANPNSTGLAAQALRAAGETAAADRAAAWVASQQVACDEGALAGAIRSPYEGLPSTEFATVQGVLAFGAAGLGELDLTSATTERPTLTCAATPAPADDPEAPTDDGTPAPGHGTDRPEADTDDAGEGGALPATGNEHLRLAALAGALLLVGSRALVTGRRRG